MVCTIAIEYAKADLGSTHQIIRTVSVQTSNLQVIALSCKIIPNMLWQNVLVNLIGKVSSCQKFIT